LLTLYLQLLKGSSIPMAKLQVLNEDYFKNESDRSVELLIPADQKVEVFFDQGFRSYSVESPEGAQESVVLEPGQHLWMSSL